MKITICGSLNFAGKMLRIRDQLVKKGHEILMPASIKDFSLKNSDDANKLKADRAKYLNNIKPYYTKNHFKLIEKSDAILVVNLDKNDIKNYIGGATFAEIMVALYLGKKIFFLNPIPKDERISFIIDEIEAAKPVVLNGDLEKISEVG